MAVDINTKAADATHTTLAAHQVLAACFSGYSILAQLGGYLAPAPVLPD